MHIHQPQLQQPLLVIVHCCVKDCVLTSATPGTPNVAKVAVRLGKSSCSTFWEVEGQDAKTESDIGFTTLSTKCAPPGVFICHFILEPLASGGGSTGITARIKPPLGRSGQHLGPSGPLGPTAEMCHETVIYLKSHAGPQGS